LKFGLETLEAVVAFGHGPDILLADNLLGQRRTDDLTEPTQMRWPPIGTAGIPEILAQEEGLQPVLGGLEIPDGILTGAGQVADGLVLDLGDIDRSEIPRAQQPGELYGVTSISFDAVAGFLWEQWGGHDPTAELFLGKITIKPIPTGTSLIDEEQMLGFGQELTDQGIDVTLPGADGAQKDDLGTSLFRGIGHGDGLFVHIQTNV
jgi:hypothetical protein